jgi:hypothetical protein
MDPQYDERDLEYVEKLVGGHDDNIDHTNTWKVFDQGEVERDEKQ